MTHASFVCNHRPLKSEPWWISIVVSGNRLYYEDDPGYPTASLLETKILINSLNRFQEGGGPTYDRVFIRVMTKLENTMFIQIIQYNCIVIFYIHTIGILNTVIIIR